MNILKGFWTVTGFLWLIGSVASVSFYGESYMHIPLDDAFRETDLELRFKASRPYGVLLLLTGGADYFLLQLHAGTLQLKINYGSEDTILDLGRHRYDDLEWHEVKVTRSDDVISMVIDGTTTTRRRIQGSHRELNIDSGIFLGGIDPLTNNKFDEELKHFRGTFSKVKLNGIDLISKARELRDPNYVVDVSFDIDSLFDAPRDSPTSLKSETSFISFSHLHPTNDRTVSFLFQTESTSALLVFSFNRHSTHKSFIALELVNGKLQLTVCKGKETMSVISDMLIDNNWHQVDLSVTSYMIELSVDGVHKSQAFGDKSGAIYGGLIFIGGVNHVGRAIVINERLESLKGENSLKGGMIGCIRNIVINSRVYNIHDIHASRLIGAECDKAEICVSGDCAIGEMTPHSDSSRDEFQLLSVNPVIVDEGMSVVITSDNIEIVYDFKKFKIRESGIMIYVVKKPKHGEIEVDLGQRRNNDVFTYLDLLRHKVRYIHLGSEHVYDEVSMGLEIFTSSRSDEDGIPERLQQRYAFILPINIKPTNDPPKIVLASGGVLKIIENTKIKITDEMFYAADPDSPANELTYLVTDAPRQGYFERSGQSGVPATEFTQAEINDRQIWFLHLGSGDSFVSLKLTDGKASSDPVQLTIHTVQLQLTVQRNKGLVLPQGSFAVISSANLTTVSNVPTQELEIRYDILRPPRYGVLERQQYANGEWKEVSTFAQRHIDSGHVRYRHTFTTEPSSSDQFSFTVKAKSYTTPYYFFRIQFEQVYIEVQANNELQLLHKTFRVLSADNLRAVTNNPHLNDAKIIFTIIRAPIHGDFFKMDSRLRGHIDFAEAKQLKREETFSQYDINTGNLYYKLKSNSFEKVSDFTDLRVQTVGTSPKNVRLWIEYIPMKSDVRFTNNGLTEVIEGGQKAIDRHCLFIQTNEFRDFEFAVITPPQHGTLQLVDPRSSAVILKDIKEFTSSDIKDLRLVYKHDDSEHAEDSFIFTAVPDIQRTSLTQNIPEFTGTFEIKMLMRNDNPPKRLVDKVFKVVKNSEKLITIDDLAYTDPDIDYDTKELQYSRRGIPNGEIIHAKTKTRIDQFKQKDIINKEIMFRHEGSENDRAAIYVTDGQFNVVCLFEIQAGDPFVEIVKNAGVVVRSNSKVIISSTNLSIETNINIEDRYIRFVLTGEPSHGHLEIDGGKVNEFSLENLKGSKLFYKHDGGSDVEDSFKFTVITGKAETHGRFSIQIELESVQLPPRVINNGALEVLNILEKNVIEEKHLLIKHPDVTPENIEYLILVMPKQGRLFRGSTLLTVDGETTFTQLDINNHRVKYELENTSATTDHFIFEVSNGYEALRGLEFLIKIEPYTLPFEVKNFTVIEGGKKELTSDLLTVEDKFSDQPVVEFTIHEPPKHGKIANGRGEEIDVFTSEDINQRNVYYIHDDSESKSDAVSLSATLGDGSKESEVKTMFVTIEGINDEAPVIVKNKGLTVWKSSMTQITPDSLCARDPDTPAKDLIYVISAPTNGHISHLNNTFKAIGSFRQSWIDDGQIVFVHEGGNTGEFSFQVSDGGHNKSPLSVFHVEARQLVLELQTNTLLNAYPNTVQPITMKHLFTSTNDVQQTKPIIYTLTSRPRHGSVVTMVDGRAMEVNSFNQGEINNSQIFYKHSDRLNGWIQNDSFEFKVNTLYAEPLASEIFKIMVSYGNLNAENKNQLIRTSPIRVDEGGEMIVAKNNLDVTEFVRNLERLDKRVRLKFSLKDAPLHGKLLYRGSELENGVQFSQRSVNAHELIYKHDDSDTVFDSFNLTLHLRIQDKNVQGGYDDENTFGLVLNVTVQPVNDEPFRLVTTNPSLQIIQGFTAVINQSVLNTVDKDTAPAYIMYEIIREADNGHVAFIEDENKQIENFTQQDINNNRVVFKHKYYKDSGAFQFSVSDGSHKRFYKSFEIVVTKLFVNITRNETVEILQSDSTVYITQENLNITTNGLIENVYYVLHGQPYYGKIYVNSKNVDYFSQKDINDNRVVYKQMDLTASSDYISLSKITYQYRSGTLGLDLHKYIGKIHIKVKPLVVTGPLLSSRSEKVALTSLNLDAAKLAERTGDNPKYSIKNGPYFGKILKKKTFSKRQIYHEKFRDTSGFNAVNEFSHEDVVYMKVYYESDINSVHDTRQDNFTYTLTAFNVQPAEGVFYIDLEPSGNTPVIPVSETSKNEQVTAKPVTQSIDSQKGVDSPINEGSVEPSRLKQNHVIILAVSIPLLLIIIITLIIVYLVWRGRRKRDYAPSTKKSPRLRPHISGPYQIEQPHIQIKPQEQDSGVSDDSHSVVEYENTHNIPGVSHAASEEADVITPMLSHDPLREMSHDLSIPRSPDITRTEISSTVPTCKVTPLIDNEVEGAVGGIDEEGRQSISSMGDMIEWITNDPELLQHCSSTSPPVLRKSQYWV
ncbi:chondroitin sulfate proteoglycan 4-like [Mercenaria mercenaria]|uniref:chondroitin sulfate proteoglycan 4-like n=1 Tax=Mercenaria mercenaria TaxID=6596 RepID=UPI00234EAACE|nr:chondroitin sulfate proteoglycan 4-like [Mercenaria mercenaria]